MHAQIKRRVDSALFCLLLVVVLAGCASINETRFFPLDEEGEVSSLPLLSTLGDKSTVAGIDVWDNGIPDRGFEELGRITNEGRSGIFARGSRLEEVARVATYQDADAVVLVRESEGICTPNNIGGADCTNIIEFAVIRYTE